MRLTALANKNLFTRRVFSSGALLAAFSPAASAQFGSLKTKLKPQTVAEFQAYAHTVETQLKSRWDGKSSFLQIDDDPEALHAVMNGELWVRTELQHSPRSISDGLIHDWFGAILIPGSTIAKVLNVLQDFDHHSSIYPQITKSRLIKRDGNDFTGHWRLEEKGQMIPAVFDLDLTTHYQEAAPDKWYSLCHADDIQSVEKSGTLPPGEGMGLMWKLYSYWTLQQVSKGVMAECRSISLSRAVPFSLAWIIRPFLNTIPRESMTSTLQNTKRASSQG